MAQDFGYLDFDSEEVMNEALKSSTGVSFLRYLLNSMLICAAVDHQGYPCQRQHLKAYRPSIQ